MSQIRLDRVGKKYGAVEVLHDISLTIERGEFTVFVGPSGCGKSTLLRSIAGLEAISSGDLHIGGKRMNDTEPSQRGVAMVFQSYALYPHMTVAENMSFGLRMAHRPKAEIDGKVRHAASILQLDALLDRKPAALSGGQRQRVAIGRAIVRNPDVFLFDEPLSNLDAELRVQTRVEIAKLHQSLGNTIVYVTHDQTEAMTLAQKIVVLRAGRVEQVGPPMALYDDPDNAFVAGFIGSPRMNFLTASVGADGRMLRFGGVEAEAPPLVRALDPGDSLRLGIRPEHLDEAAGIALPARAEVVERLGSTAFVHGRLATGEAIVAERREAAARPGEDLTLRFDMRKARLFTADGARLR
ncbi:ABC transporter ATP-binding protein [Labrys monachus]|uniref:Lactose/L-arabinose transport system ATP-binding protein n=1 Tax=Labrys monachus TaxID=217067 RepID=A0ABU0F8C5_9HYPH|nr:sn-glycerol-3-phosphate ABC transporter ATP-binding protein UgpC [Labrys monachus]MDQ0390691.1 lactose/L-arabinose transport system ATP-binding protein [Labrys monachus]